MEIFVRFPGYIGSFFTPSFVDLSRLSLVHGNKGRRSVSILVDAEIERLMREWYLDPASIKDALDGTIQGPADAPLFAGQRLYTNIVRRLPSCIVVNPKGISATEIVVR